MSVSITIRLGPMAEITAHGQNCQEIAKQLDGWQKLNEKVEKLSADLAEKMYPEEGDGGGQQQQQQAQEAS